MFKNSVLSSKEKPSICTRCGYGSAKFKYKTKLDSREKDCNPCESKDELTGSDKIIEELRRKGKKAIASRDKWKKEAEDAQAKITALEKKISKLSTNNSDSKFKKVKHTFSQMYHPDKIVGDKFEKMIKQEIFKEFWQEIKKIDAE